MFSHRHKDFDVFIAFKLVHEVILPALEKNVYVLSDRFHDSSIAYQAFGRKIDLDFVMNLQKFVIGKAVPNLTFFIDVPIGEIVKRMSKVKKVELDRIESSKIDFYERVRNGYLYLAENENRFRKIDGTLSIEDIHNQILNEIEKQEK